MKNVIILTMITGVLFSACNEPQQQSSPEQLTEAIKERNQVFMNGIKENDAAKVANLYTEDALLMAPNAPVFAGKGEVEKFMQGALSNGIKEIKLITTDVQGNNELAIEEGKYEMYIDGNVKVDEGKYLVQWKNVNNTWHLYKDIFNSNNPSPRIVASKDQDVNVFIHSVKADMDKAYEDFINNVVIPGVDQSIAANAMAVRQTRILKPGSKNNEGNLDYVIIMDPVVKGVDYSIQNILVQKYGEEEGQKKASEFNAMLAKPIVGYYAKQAN
ncbi:MAG: YybH family protein [Candidatus Cyclobacteriaceae bacterium M2_1C_046]